MGGCRESPHLGQLLAGVTGLAREARFLARHQESQTGRSLSPEIKALNVRLHPLVERFDDRTAGRLRS